MPLPLLVPLGIGAAAGAGAMYAGTRNKTASDIKAAAEAMANNPADKELNEVAKLQMFGEHARALQAEARALKEAEMNQSATIARENAKLGFDYNQRAADSALERGGVTRYEDFLTTEALNKQIAASNLAQATEQARLAHLANMDTKGWDTSASIYGDAMNFGRNLLGTAMEGVQNYKG